MSRANSRTTRTVTTKAEELVAQYDEMLHEGTIDKETHDTLVANAKAEAVEKVANTYVDGVLIPYVVKNGAIVKAIRLSTSIRGDAVTKGISMGKVRGTEFIPTGFIPLEEFDALRHAMKVAEAKHSGK